MGKLVVTEFVSVVSVDALEKLERVVTVAPA